MTRVLPHLVFLATTAILAACGSGGGDGSGNSSTSSSANPLAAQSTTSQPTASPSTTSSSTGSITLEWNPNKEPDLAGYRVYRSTSSGNYGAPIATVPANAASYVVSGLQPGVTYFFVITAYDNAGNESSRSAEISATL